MFCTNCGNQLNKNINFCPACGMKVYEKTGQPAVYEEKKMVTDRKILKRLSRRVSINSFVWILIAIGQAISGVKGILGGTGIMTYGWMILLGVTNFYSAIVELFCRNDIVVKPVDVVDEYKITKSSWKTYAWNLLIAVAGFVVGDYIFMLLVVAAIVTDLFMVKLYVLIHKKEFLYLEEQMIEMRRRGEL